MLTIAIISVFAVAMVVVVILVFALRRKKRERVFAEWLQLKHKDLACAANGEYLNWSKAKRVLSPVQETERRKNNGTDYSATDEHALTGFVRETPGEYSSGEHMVHVSRIIEEINRNFVEKRLAESTDFFDKLGLTETQRLAVVRDEDANLINAGAGSGKTRTIIGKIQYILSQGLAAPNEILVVVYNKQNQREAEQKIGEVAPGVVVKTFHAFGLSVLKSVDGNVAVSALTESDNLLGKFLTGIMTGLLKKSSILAALVAFFSTHHTEPDAEDGVVTKDDYLRKVRYAEMRALNGDELRSHQEVEIANWLTLNGIRWEYERDYPYSAGTRQHKPDFYLPDYDLWVEHFGVDEHGNNDRQGWDNENYRETMAWKRETHHKHGTTLVETYSHEARAKGGLAHALAHKLAAHGVRSKPLSDDEINRVVAKSFAPQSKFIKLIIQFINLCRENKLGKAELAGRVRSSRDGAFLTLFNFFRYGYETKLEADGEIDFVGMIVRAMQYAKTGKYRSGFKYILVDEYQDITQVRLEFLLALQEHVEDARLFCVGDDWQSIYQFNGANVGLITRFEDYVGAMQRTDLDKTFRYPQKISDFSRMFITENPHQLKKSINSAVSSAADARPIRVIYHDEHGQQEKLHKIIDTISRQSQCNATCFVLGRYNRDLPQNWGAIKQYARKSEVHIDFRTIHGSKGLEAEWVVVVENKNDSGGYGFPSGIQSDPVLRMVLAQDDFPLAEERRLFYVAVTRARRGVFLLAPAGEASDFIKEIDPRNASNEKYKPLVHVEDDTDARVLICPVCTGQTIRKKSTAVDGSFYACSHYPQCNGTLPSCSCGAAIAVSDFGADTTCECGNVFSICPRCNLGVLMPREGKYGKFWGCSRYGNTGCDYTQTETDKNASLSGKSRNRQSVKIAAS